MATGLQVPAPSGVVAARDLVDRSAKGAWCLDSVRGRFVEITGATSTAALTATAALVLEAQRHGELAAWIGGEMSIFFPPDFAAWGIDLDALPIVRTRGAVKAFRAAGTLLCSGSFALVVLDIGCLSTLPLAIQTRLVGLAANHHTGILCITQETRYTRRNGSSLVSLRMDTQKERAGQDCFSCELRAVKDKRNAPGWRHVEVCRGPDGLC